MKCSTFNESYYIAIIHVFYIVNILKVHKTQLKWTVKVLLLSVNSTTLIH